PENLVCTYGSMVSSLCRRMIQNDESARDAAQEVWYEIIRNLNSFRGDSKISTWIYTIATRVILKLSLAEKRYTTQFLKDFFHGEKRISPTTDDIKKEYWVKDMCNKCLSGILHCLDNEARLAYILREMACIEYDELAQILGKDEAAVRKSISRSRRKLRNFLNDECALFNPSGSCHCRMKPWVEQIDLPREFEKLRITINRVNIYRESESVLPTKNYWEALL
ncbi:MAG: sigma-70 family RNA polymerase sigma factor, partial [Deltaproteobacteria bacterium]|nr:sigma-70 family RNA polymerase sigma factor [Deltaproteobacteria bacterium]